MLLLLARLSARPRCARIVIDAVKSNRNSSRFLSSSSTLLKAKSKAVTSASNTLKPPPPKPVSKDVVKSKTGQLLSPATSSARSPELYPPQLLIYHAGKWLTNVIAVCKLTAIFVFVFTVFYVTPQYYIAPDEPFWMVPASIALGSIPLAFMMFSTYPLTIYSHLNLPQWARISSEKLKRYVANLPPNASLEMTTLRWLTPRITRLNVSELYIPQAGVSGKLAGAMALRRHVLKEVTEARKWYQWRPVRGFMVTGNSGNVPERFIWMEIMTVARNAFLAQEEKEANDKRRKVFRSVAKSQTATR